MHGVYLDEAIYLIEKINKRRMTEYKIQASIASFPSMTKEGKQQFISNLQTYDDYSQKTFDSTSFEALKFAMSQNPRVIVK